MAGSARFDATARGGSSWRLCPVRILVFELSSHHMMPNPIPPPGFTGMSTILLLSDKTGSQAGDAYVC
jgi:hypothetical protein